MTTNAMPLRVGESNGCLWIRCEGRGAFKVGAALKRYVEGWMARTADKVLVIDLEACVGMDSTFMGTLAGLAGRLQKVGGELQVVSIDAKNRALLEDLGIDFLLEIEPEAASWRGHESEIRANLHPMESEVARDAHALQVLEAHRNLSDLNPENRAKFGDLLQILTKENKNEGDESR